MTVKFLPVTCPNVTTPALPVTAPVTGITATYISRSASIDSPTGYKDNVSIAITTGAGAGSQPYITIYVNGASIVYISRPISSSTSIQVTVPSTGSVYSICADSTCTNYTSSCYPTTAPVTSVTVGSSVLRIDGSGNVWDDIVLTIVTGQGYCAQPTIPLSVDGITYLQITRPINSTFAYTIGVSGKAGGSVYTICTDATCTNYTSKVQYAASNGTTPIGTVVCIVSVTQPATITGWNSSIGKYQTSYQGNYYLPGNIKLGVC